MNTRITRRRLMAGAAALPIAAALPAEAKSEHGSDSEKTQFAELAPPVKPDISEIPGLDQVAHVLCVMVVTTPDGRVGSANLAFHGFGAVDAIISTGDGWHQSIVPVDGIESLPTWLQREIGYAALTASDDRWPR